MSSFKTLTTPFEENVECWKNEYPRPQLKRKSWLSLSGQWDFSTNDFTGTINVPFAPQSRLSGVEKDFDKGEMVYKKTFSIPEGFNQGKILIHFGAVDQLCKVFINNSFVTEHVGGYTPFFADITPFIEDGENVVTVKVTDNLDLDIPYGKQTKNRGGMWYTPISGIWQTVWLESVPENHIEALKITPSLKKVKISVTGGGENKKLIMEDREYSFSGNTVEIEIEKPINWTPENPHLYYFTLTDGVDEVESYFALRTMEVKNGEMCLNGKPYFFHGVLDQGYFADGIYTPGSPQGYEADILTMKELGFNMLRKHIKIEPDIFYYYCDKLGMAVFQDAVNNSDYNYFLDTVLPTIGLKKSFDRKRSARAKRMFEKTLSEMTKILYNHPSVLYYTIFNEGWGQFEADLLYDKMKKEDPTRIWDATSGWFAKKKSDVDSHHIYFRRIKLKKRKRPLVLSEFGGYSYKIDRHSFNLEKTYGYKKIATKEDFEKEIEKLYLEDIVPNVKKGLCAAVLTQLSDVEDETNGLMTYDRKVVKVDKKKMKKISRALFKAFKKKNRIG